MERTHCVPVFAALLLLSAPAFAQDPLPPLPPLPPQPTAPAPSPAPPPARAPGYGQPPPDYAPPPAWEAPSAPHASRPPQYVPTEYPADELLDTHAPKYSLWLGGRLGALTFADGFYVNEHNHAETTGNFVTSGVGVELDAGARLGKRYVPYVFVEHGFVGTGHRFAGADASASSDLLGVGFRYTALDVDNVGFLTDISVGMRTITVSSGGDTYKMSGLEILRLSLGAEIRMSTRFVLTPAITISSGALTDTSGHVNFSASGSGDGLTHPTYQNGQGIDTQYGYVVLGLGCGGHFDLFGR